MWRTVDTIFTELLQDERIYKSSSREALRRVAERKVPAEPTGTRVFQLLVLILTDDIIGPPAQI